MHAKGRCRLASICSSLPTIIFALLILFGCSTPPTTQSEEVQFGSLVVRGKDAQGKDAPERTLSRADLQDAMLRFETEFTARTQDAFRPLTQSSLNSIRKPATRANLTYAITSLDIALGVIPEQNLLDMLIYIELIRDVFRDYWIPKVYGKSGKPVLRSFDESAKELRTIAESYLTTDQLAELKLLADTWHANNPNRIAVETVRLSDFSAEAGARAKQLQSRISGLFAPVAAASLAAAQGILLGERVLYYAQRTPSLLGMQSTVTLQDAIKEVTSSISDFSFSRAHTQQFQDFLAQSEAMLKQSEARLMTQGRRFFQMIFLGSLGLILFSGVVYVLARLVYDHFSKKRTAVNFPEKRKAA